MKAAAPTFELKKHTVAEFGEIVAEQVGDLVGDVAEQILNGDQVDLQHSAVTLDLIAMVAEEVGEDELAGAIYAIID